jgi:peptidylprolyl isomerase
MAQAQKGDKVTFNYTGKLEDGTVFDSTLESDCTPDECDDDNCGTDDCGCGGHETGPIELSIGSGEFFPQIEEALVGMAPGDKKTVVVPTADAFGEYDETKVFTVPRSDLPADMAPEVGDELLLTGEDDEELAVGVAEVTEESITFDANHPLAGEDLTFDIELVAIL